MSAAGRDPPSSDGDWHPRFPGCCVAAGAPGDEDRRPALGRFINDCRPYNCVFEKKPEAGIAEVVALREIQAGEEIFASYGVWYWMGHKIMNGGGRNKKRTDHVDLQGPARQEEDQQQQLLRQRQQESV